ncbi:N-acetyltransferase [Streptacidiphilus pinicola]|uniref:N-acetyltransferase n=1 Tax=Streptacidiphilus pinicola TaxID=2219663 RepID=A0A2X0IDX9_9ACTN|nr:GNAT family N-acetyltransferase [Streptacidiphilus pinicola]RAG82747.1 N-acetyltransferase [Streptacidiphilus pinicola]
MTTSTTALTPLTLTGDGLLLRPLSLTDEPAIAEALRDPEILRWAGGRTVAEAPEAERARFWLGARLMAWSTGSAVFAITDATRGADGVMLGFLAAREVNRLPDQAVMTYWITPAARGRGLASNALETAAHWALSPTSKGGLGLHRLSLDHALANPGSCRVAEKAGFALEGTMRDFYVDPSGLRHDSHLHARLARPH